VGGIYPLSFGIPKQNYLGTRPSVPPSGIYTPMLARAFVTLMHISPGSFFTSPPNRCWLVTGLKLGGNVLEVL